MPSSSLAAKLNHSSHFFQIIERWLTDVGIKPENRPDLTRIAHKIESGSVRIEFSRPASIDDISQWEERHRHHLPIALKAFLKLSNGLKINGTQWIHPLKSIGPAIRFHTSTRIFHQPVSWYEFGNPADIPANIDLLSTKIDTDSPDPVFILGDGERELKPRVIASGFRAWFYLAMEAAFEIEFLNHESRNLGDPIEAHYRLKKPPKLSPRHCKICSSVGEKLSSGLNERQIMREFQLNREDLEQILDAFQYRREKMAGSRHSD